MTARTMRDILAEQAEAGLTVARRGRPVGVHVADGEAPGVHTAVTNLRADLESACGAPAHLADPATARIIVGTLGRSPVVDAAVDDGSIDLSSLRDGHGELAPEGRLACVVGEVLYLVGTDTRGTIYAVYDFTRAIGVSPWRWWADVPVRARDHVTVRQGATAADHPSVRYRGIFLNDEEELQAWAKQHTSDDGIGPETYTRVCELLLRLGGNYLWPAMHVGAFNHDPANARTAHELGVIVGTSHCDMLLRSNEHEFRPWAEARGEDVEYDYSLPGRNRELLLDYWRGSVVANREYEATWNVGMRGIHDYGFTTAAIDDDPALDDAGRRSAKVDLLGRVIADQRALLTEALGETATDVPQLFIPYKEVLDLYDAGLEVPDDITIVWADDNYGHVRRLPSEAERLRRGGHGLYYHASYWADLTSSYLATSSTPLALMGTELRRAWDGGIQRLWVLNIGGLKPLEHELSYFLTLAWEIGRDTTTDDVDEFTAAWHTELFGGSHGAEVAVIHGAYSQLNQQRKVEHLDGDTFDQVVHGDEAGRRLADLADLARRTAAVAEQLPADQQDAFFQLLAVKVHLAHLMAGQFYHADRSRLAHQQGKLAAADHHLALSREYDDAVASLIHHYNHGIAGGRWSGMFTPRSFPPPVLPLFPAAQPALRVGPPRLGVVTWGGEPPDGALRLTFHPHGVGRQWFEVFTTGRPGLSYEIEADPWLTLSRTSGSVDDEHRIHVHLADPADTTPRRGRIRVSSPETGDEVCLEVVAEAAPPLPDGFVGSLEADGHLTVDPSRPDAVDDGAWAVVPRLGRYGNAVLRARAATDATPSNRTAEFHFHLSTPGAHRLEVHRLPTLDATGRVRLAVSVDHHPPVEVESPITDEHRGQWRQAVRDGVERLSLVLPALEAGAHTLRLHAVDAHVTVSKLTIHTGPRRATNLGPGFSAHTTRPLDDAQDPDPTPADGARLRRWVRRLFPASTRISPPDQVYVPADFWATPTVFKPNLVRPQAHGQPADTCDRVAALGTGAALEVAGSIAFEAENALAEDASAWTTPGRAGEAWTHTQAETQARTGLAMHVLPRGLSWEEGEGPGLHQRIRVMAGGRYRAWLLAKYDDHASDRCQVALDGLHQPTAEQFCGGSLATYGTRQTWNWVALCDLDLAPGEHTFSLLARTSGLRVDRILLTRNGNLPPVDAEWIPSPRVP